MANISEIFSGSGPLIVIFIMIIPIGFGIWWYNRRKNPKREQNALLITEDMRIKPVNLPVELGYVVSHAWNQAWLLDPNIMIHKRNSPLNWAIFDERDAAPQAINKRAEERRRKFEQDDDSSGNKEEKEFNRIAKQRGEESITKVVVNQEKEKSQELLKTVALALVALFILVIVATMAVNKFRG